MDRVAAVAPSLRHRFAQVQGPQPERQTTGRQPRRPVPPASVSRVLTTPGAHRRVLHLRGPQRCLIACLSGPGAEARLPAADPTAVHVDASGSYRGALRARQAASSKMAPYPYATEIVGTVRKTMLDVACRCFSLRLANPLTVFGSDGCRIRRRAGRSCGSGTEHVALAGSRFAVLIGASLMSCHRASWRADAPGAWPRIVADVAPSATGRGSGCSLG